MGTVTLNKSIGPASYLDVANASRFLVFKRMTAGTLVNQTVATAREAFALADEVEVKRFAETGRKIVVDVYAVDAEGLSRAILPALRHEIWVSENSAPASGPEPVLVSGGDDAPDYAEGEVIEVDGDGEFLDVTDPVMCPVDPQTVSPEQERLEAAADARAVAEKALAAAPEAVEGFRVVEVASGAPKAKKPSKARPAPKGDRAPRGKTALVGEMLQRDGGVTLAELLQATGWPTMSVPAQATACGLVLRKEKVKGEPTRYFGSPSVA